MSAPGARAPLPRGRGLTRSGKGLLSTGVDIGTSVFVPSVPFLDFGSVVTGLLQGPIGAGGEFLDTVGAGRPVPPGDAQGLTLPPPLSPTGAPAAV